MNKVGECLPHSSEVLSGEIYLLFHIFESAIGSKANWH